MLFGDFLRNRRGNIAVAFGLSILPVMTSVGATVDYARLSDARERMQNALDAAVLALSSEADGMTASAINTRALQLFNANFVANGVSNVAVTASYVRNGGATITARASGTVDIMVLNVIGVSSQTIAATAETNWSSTRLRIALALDNTGSMNASGKITALKTAATGLVDKLKAASSKPGDVYVSIIPFNRDVNVGSANRDANWLRWDGTTRSCSRYSCTTVSIYPYSDKTYWTGCVTDRDRDYDISNVTPSTAATRFYAEQYSSCPKALTPLTYDWTTLTSAIDAMTTGGSTNQAIGLAWAWQSLSAGAPLDAPAKPTGYDYEDVIILLSDGENTQDRWGGDGQNAWALADQRMSAVCTAAKTAGVVIYTVLVIDGNEDVLRQCASSEDKYFNAQSATDIIKTFGVIGDKLTQLRIAH